MNDLTLGRQPDFQLPGISLFLEFAQVLDRTSYLFMAGLNRLLKYPPPSLLG